MNNMSIGIDIINISNLREKMERSEEFLNKILSTAEIVDFKIETIAGKIAAKEAIIKTGFIAPGKWKEVVISSSSDGKPIVSDKKGDRIDKIKISISHTEDTAVAVAIYEKN